MNDLNIKVLRFYLKNNMQTKIKVSGDCMGEWITDETVIVKPYTSIPHVGDVVLLETENHIKIHRILNIYHDNNIKTKGDYGVVYDQNTLLENVLGYVYLYLDFDTKRRKQIDKVIMLSNKIAIVYKNKRILYKTRISLIKSRIRKLSNDIFKT